MTRLGTRLRISHPGSRWAIGIVAASVFLCGVWWRHAGLLGGGAAVLCLVFRAVGEEVQQRKEPFVTKTGGHSAHHAAAGGESQRTLPLSPAAKPKPTGPPATTSALVRELLSTGRYALLLRPETNQHLSPQEMSRAIQALDNAMSLVPAGKVLLGHLAECSNSSGGLVDAKPKQIERHLRQVEPVYLDRFAVSNEQYQRFVDAGGYEQLECWDEEALPALLDFVDQTGHPGPRFWSDGHNPLGEERRPVVGVSWYEASALASWVGKRLPTDAEWTKSGAWPVESAPGRIVQRPYPWGESSDVRRANLWGSGYNQPADVDEFADGASVGGVYQLVGNVWEWTVSPLCESADLTLHVPDTMKSIRGGAFDTYFESQATCHYQSGEQPLARRRNIGFRLALPMADLVPATPRQSAAPTAANDEQSHCTDEVAVTC